MLARANGTGYRRIDSGVMCVITRFQVQSFLALLAFLRMYRRIVADARTIKGLIATSFLLENTKTCYTLSIWSDEAAILEFNSRVRAHVAAANVSFRTLATGDDKRPLLWSAQFKLFAVSEKNLRWKGVTFPIDIHGREVSGASHSF